MLDAIQEGRPGDLPEFFDEDAECLIIATGESCLAAAAHVSLRLRQCLVPVLGCRRKHGKPVDCL